MDTSDHTKLASKRAQGSSDRVRRRTRAQPRSRHEPTVLGWTELVDLPDWGIRRLPAKMDTGARSSALHVEELEELGHNRVSFFVRLHRKQRDRRIRVESPITRRGRIRSSTGHYTTRIFVATTMRIGTVDRPIELSLVDREEMIFRMLIGRTALRGTFLIDPAHRRLLTRTVRS